MSDDDDDWVPLSERLEWADVTPLPLVRASRLRTRACAVAAEWAALFWAAVRVR
jgi:hypothetical protein